MTNIIAHIAVCTFSWLSPGNASEINSGVYPKFSSDIIP